MFRKPNFAFWDSHSRFWLISITKRVLCSYTKVYDGKKIKKESWQYLVHFRNGANLERKKKNQVLSHNGMGRTILKRQLYSLSISLSILFWKTNRFIKLQAFLHNYWRCNGQVSSLTLALKFLYSPALLPYPPPKISDDKTQILFLESPCTKTSPINISTNKSYTAIKFS